MLHNHTVIKVAAVKREKNDDCHNCCCFTLCVANLYKKAASNWRMACVNKLQKLYQQRIITNISRFFPYITYIKQTMSMASGKIMAFIIKMMKKYVPVYFSFAFMTVSSAVQGQPAQQTAGISSVETAFTGNGMAPAGNGMAPATAVITGNRVYTPVPNVSADPGEARYAVAITRLKDQAAAIKEYAGSKNFNTDICFLVDMSVPSGKNRFFVYNLKTGVVENESLVAHGFGSTVKGSDNELIFSNNAYSFKTSLGKYKIGKSYTGKYGLAYKLYGLDDTNNKAFERTIVLHADIHMPKNEVYPARIFQSAGCPTLSPEFLPVVSKYINSSKKPILMWIYN